MSGEGGGGVEARRPGNSLDTVFLVRTYFTVYRVDPMVLLQRGGGGPTSSSGGGGVQRNPYNL